jgi:hypothetical protein
MKTLVINTENDIDLIFLQTLINKLGFKSAVLSDNDKENIAMLNAIQEVKNTNIYSLNDAEVIYQSLKKAK